MSVVNTSLDSNLWEMGAYFLTECKNWTDKVGIPVIRALSYSSNMKGKQNDAVVCGKWGNGDGKREILRAAVNRQFILCFTKQELLEVKNGRNVMNFWLENGGS